MYKLKHIKFLLFINLLCLQLQAQQVYFNNRYDWGQAETALSVLRDSNQYVIIDVWTDFSTEKTNIVFIDTLGIFLNKKTYSSNYASYYGGREGSLIKTTDGGYALAGSYVDSINSGDAILYKFNSAGDTLWTRTYGDSAFQDGNMVKQASDGGYIICGETCTYDPNGDVLLIKTDSLGNLQWQKHYGASMEDAATSICLTPDNGFLLGGVTNSPSNGYEDSLFIKTDSIGNFKWLRHFGGPYNDFFSNVFVSKDGNYVGGGLILLMTHFLLTEYLMVNHIL